MLMQFVGIRMNQCQKLEKLRLPYQRNDFREEEKNHFDVSGARSGVYGVLAKSRFLYTTEIKSTLTFR